MPLAGARRVARQQALPHDPGPRPCGRRALRHPRRWAGPLQGKGRLPLVAEADHVGLITRIWYHSYTYNGLQDLEPFFGMEVSAPPGAGPDLPASRRWSPAARARAGASGP